MEGAPSAVDLFDPKPELDKNHGKKMAIDVFNGNPGPLMKSPFTFRQYGESGAWVCEKYPNVAQHVDDIAFVKSCFTESNDHVPALYQMNTGISRPGLPTAGAWVTYGLGSENQNLPGFVVLGNTQGIKGGPLNWSAGFLPTTYQGTLFRSQGSPVLNLKRPRDTADEDQRAQLDLLARLNGEHLGRHAGEPDLSTRIETFELAYRMQMEATDLVDFSQESAETRNLYGLEDPASRSFGQKCLMARRLVERGVRFVQVYSDGEWDAHSDLAGNHSGHCAATDVPIHGLLTDLKRRGLLDSTLVIWGGEFGRMPVSQGNERPRPQPEGLPRLDGRRRHQGRGEPRRDRRDRLPRRVRPGHGARPARDDAAPARPRPQATDLPAQRPPLPADGRGGERAHQDPGIAPRTSASSGVPAEAVAPSRACFRPVARATRCLSRSPTQNSARRFSGRRRGSPALAEDEHVAVGVGHRELLAPVPLRHDRPEVGHVPPGPSQGGCGRRRPGCRLPGPWPPSR